jgi:hypothetical protein
MDIDLADVTIHVDQPMDEETATRLEDTLRQRMGVVSVRINPDRPQLVIVEYNPKQINSRDLVDVPRFMGMSAELVGL